MPNVDEATRDAVYAAAQAVDDATHLLEVAAAAVGRGDLGREVALAKTNVEQGGLWLDAVVRKIG